MRAPATPAAIEIGDDQARPVRAPFAATAAVVGSLRRGHALELSPLMRCAYARELLRSTAPPEEPLEAVAITFTHSEVVFRWRS